MSAVHISLSTLSDAVPVSDPAIVSYHIVTLGVSMEAIDGEGMYRGHHWRRRELTSSNREPSNPTTGTKGAATVGAEGTGGSRCCATD